MMISKEVFFLDLQSSFPLKASLSNRIPSFHFYSELGRLALSNEAFEVLFTKVSKHFRFELTPNKCD